MQSKASCASRLTSPSASRRYWSLPYRSYHGKRHHSCRDHGIPEGNNVASICVSVREIRDRIQVNFSKHTVPRTARYPLIGVLVISMPIAMPGRETALRLRSLSVCLHSYFANPLGPCPSRLQLNPSTKRGRSLAVHVHPISPFSASPVSAQYSPLPPPCLLCHQAPLSCISLSRHHMNALPLEFSLVSVGAFFHATCPSWDSEAGPSTFGYVSALTLTVLGA